MTYLCACCHRITRVVKGYLHKISAYTCWECNWDYWHEDWENSDEEYDFLWIDMGGEG